MRMHIPAAWSDAFADLEHASGLVFAVDRMDDRWSSVQAELRTVFELTRACARNSEPVVYVVHNDDLLGRRGPGRAMVATGLLSAARTLSLEFAKSGTAVNVLAIEDSTEPSAIARWDAITSEPGGPSGELIHLGTGHVGKALA
jgi:hypothetical protein